MGEAACDLLEAELALDRLEAELAAELPAHLRAFAGAYAAGTPPPAAPRVARRPASLSAARRALPHPLLADRALALVRLLAPLAIDDEPAVAQALRATPTWPALRALITARDAAAHHLFGCRAIELTHALHGVAAPATPRVPRTDHDVGPAVAGWGEHGAVLAHEQILDTWGDLARRHGIGAPRQAGARHPPLHVELGAAPRPRAFVIEPLVAVTIVLPRVIDTPAARFAVLHELGHAVANLLSPAGLPRVLDEGVASYVARLAEDERATAWFDPRATAARERRTRLALWLDAIECRLPDDLGEPPLARPPWALWHDPGAQAAYVAAEAFADRLWATLGPAPAPGALARMLADERAAIDRVTAL